MGVPALELNEDNACALIFRSEVQIDMSYDGHDRSMHLCGIVGVLKRPNVPESLKKLLEANAMTRDLRGNHFAFDPMSESAVLCASLHEHEQNLERLVDEIASLVAACQTWRQQFVREGIVIG